MLSKYQLFCICIFNLKEFLLFLSQLKVRDEIKLKYVECTNLFLQVSTFWGVLINMKLNEEEKYCYQYVLHLDAL